MSFLHPDADVVSAYLDLRARVIDLLVSIPDASADLAVPHCPNWSVRDVVAHMAGVVEDILAGRMEGVTTEAWTQAQVDRHRHETLSEVRGAWTATITDFDVVLPHIPSPVNAQFVMDAVTHEHDLRHALGVSGARDSLAVRVAVGWLLDMAEGRAPGTEQVLRAPGLADFDLLRVLTGRRSAAQMNELGLDGEAITSLLTGSPLIPPRLSIDE